MTAADWADISHHQESVNLAAYAAAGHRMIGIKSTGGATDGTLRYVDPVFATRWRQAADQGLTRVTYHYARNNNSGAAELDWCLDRIESAGGFLPGDILCYDQEDTRAGSSQPLAVQRTQEFTRAAVQAGITTGWLYSGKWYLEPALLHADNLPPGWRNLWISDYGTRADASIAVPNGWSRDHLVARQYTEHASVAGIGSPCDYNRLLRTPIVQPPQHRAPREVDMFVALRDDGVAYLVRPYGMVPLGPDSLAAYRKALDVIEFTGAEITAMRGPIGMPGLGDALQRDVAALASTTATRLQSIAMDIGTITGSARPLDAGAVAAQIAELLQTLVLDGLEAQIRFGVTDEP